MISVLWVGILIGMAIGHFIAIQGMNKKRKMKWRLN